MPGHPIDPSGSPLSHHTAHMNPNRVHEHRGPWPRSLAVLFLQRRTEEPDPLQHTAKDQRAGAPDILQNQQMPGRRG